MTRFGIFGGTFNPIHIGHLRSAEEVREAHQLDRMLLIPSANPPHKPGLEVVAARHRLAMARIAVRQNPHLSVSPIELERPGRSFSVDTVRELRRKHPRVEFSFVLGIDAFREIATWRDYLTLFSLCDVVVTSRPPQRRVRLANLLPVAAAEHFCYQRRTNVLTHTSGHRIVFQTICDLGISATDIRRLVALRRSIRYLVPDGVAEYMARHDLYSTKD